MGLSFFIYTVLTALLPGPNNILALNNSMTRGYKNSRSLLWGIYTGFTLIIFLSAVFTEFLMDSFKGALDYLKYVGAVYLMYLAWMVIRSKPFNPDRDIEAIKDGENRKDFWKGFFLQLINVKIMIYGITAFSSFVLPYYQNPIIIAGFIIFLSLVGSSATFVWAVAGHALTLFLNRHFKTVNTVMGILLVYCAISLFF